MREYVRSVRHSKFVGLVVALAVLACDVPLWSQANAASYYISPTGSDSNSGISSGAPWRTFSFAIPKLRPGDSLILKDGTYNASNSGYPSIDCSTSANQGTTSAVITIKAENERKAFLKGDGSINTFQLMNCSYWSIDGLRVESGDNSAGQASGAGSPIAIVRSSNITLRRLLVSFANRWVNVAAMQLIDNSNLLVEENELYSFHRHGISGNSTSTSVFRRNYINSRGYSDLAGCTGYPTPAVDGTPRCSAPSYAGDSAISLYPGSDNIMENNISEGQGVGFGIQAAYGPVTNNQYLGNISINDAIGMGLFARSENVGIQQMPQNTTVKDLVVVNPMARDAVSVYLRGNKNTNITGLTVIGNNASGVIAGFIADTPSDAPGDGKPSFFLDNALVINNSPSVGFSVQTSTHTTWRINATNAFDNNPNYSPSSHPNIMNATTIDPKLGTCKVFIPSSSPMKGAGIGGLDKGANVLYRYQKGVLTNQPLWDPVTGAFPHGAMVPGVNDIAGSSAFDVHKRLNVNTNGCPFPAGYASGAAVASSTSQTSSTTIAQTSPSTGPVGYWKFDEGSGTSVNDVSGNGSTGTLINGPSWTTGIKGKALSFDGIDDYVNINNAPAINVTGTGITVQALVKGTGPGNYKYIVSKTDALYAGYGLYTGDSGTIRFYVGNGSGLIMTPDVTSPWDDRWHHVAGTYDGSKLSLYIDGVVRASVAASGNIADSSSRPLNIGRFSEGGFFFKGAIDEVQIYNRALSPTEIQQLYNSFPVVTRPSSPVNLVVTK